MKSPKQIKETITRLNSYETDTYRQGQRTALLWVLEKANFQWRRKLPKEKYLRCCKRCLEIFPTNKRHSKICSKCDRSLNFKFKKLQGGKK